MGLNTLTIETDGYPAIEALTGEARKKRRMGRAGVLTELLLQEICHMAEEEADDGVKARLIQAGVNVGQAMRTVLD